VFYTEWGVLMDNKLSNPSVIQEILKSTHFKIKKQLGQNFLVDENILNGILNSANITSSDNILEVGPGLGALSQYLAEKAKRVIAIELDSKVIPLLKKNLTGYKNFEVIEGDFLKEDIESLIGERFLGEPYKIVANLPYYITTPILFRILELKTKPVNTIVMVQREVADRIVAKPGGKDYGILSINIQMFADVNIEAIVSRNSFIPKPNVDSAILKLFWREKPLYEIGDKKMFVKVVKAALSQRRKTLLNTITNIHPEMTKPLAEDLLNKCNINPQRRAETLDLEEFANLALKYQKIWK
jgi:16S rRNA (adenine1518-N6/adenine1519-N6)-dimethyltransferase